MAKKVAANDFKLDTKSMDQAINDCKKLAEKMRELKQQLQDGEVALIGSWEGEGSTAFQKKFHVLSQQLGDLKDDLYCLAEDIKTAQEVYIQADTDSAKYLNTTSNV